MPARLVEEQHRMRAGRHGLANLRQLGRHSLGVAVGQNKTRALALCRADGTKDVGPQRALVVWR
jgi:hypothetical protein